MEFWDKNALGNPLVPALEAINNATSEPPLTIGIPVYKRPKELRRCLKSLTQQTQLNFHLILSNDFPGEDLAASLSDFEFGEIHRITIYNQPRNIGSLSNFRFLRDIACTPFFMWLANDDMISENYVEDLMKMHEQNPSAVCAMGQWELMVSPSCGAIRSQHMNDASNAILRIIKYIWCADDAFFYGIFRRDALLKGDFPGYWWPNRGFIKNWCYVFQIYILFHGPVVYSKECKWINHDYGEKLYPGTPSLNAIVFENLASAARRLNVYVLYFRASLSQRPALSPVVAIVSMLSMFRELFTWLTSQLRKLIGSVLARGDGRRDLRD